VDQAVSSEAPRAAPQAAAPPASEPAAAVPKSVSIEPAPTPAVPESVPTEPAPTSAVPKSVPTEPAPTAAVPKSVPTEPAPTVEVTGIDSLFANGKKPNIVMILTDQERSLQHWPESFTKEHLPAMSKLMESGLSFKQGFTSAACCAPSRASFVTSKYPFEHGVQKTGTPQPEVTLPVGITTIASILTEVGYTCVWKGKWHIGGDPEDHGFMGWNPPECGNSLSQDDTMGGGTPNNDGRVVKDMVKFLDNPPEPFFMFASFVNPHDCYAAQHDPVNGYSQEDFNRVQVPAPTNWDEDLDTKPRAQKYMSIPYVPFKNSVQEYCNFYAYLHTLVDSKILKLLNKIDESGIADNTLTIRFADHGEMSLSHGLVEKVWNSYEESIHIPFVFHNPKIWPTAQTSDSMASSMDLLPTLCDLLGVLEKYEGEFRGNSLKAAIQDPSKSVQDTIHFTFDDVSLGNIPSVLRCIRSAKYKYTVYFTEDGRDADWELYDLMKDPLENNNLAGIQEHIDVQREMENKLVETMTKKKTIPTDFTWPPNLTMFSRGADHHGQATVQMAEGKKFDLGH